MRLLLKNIIDQKPGHEIDSGLRLILNHIEGVGVVEVDSLVNLMHTALSLLENLDMSHEEIAEKLSKAILSFQRCKSSTYHIRKSFEFVESYILTIIL